MQAEHPRTTPWVGLEPLVPWRWGGGLNGEAGLTAVKGLGYRQLLFPSVLPPLLLSFFGCPSLLPSLCLSLFLLSVFLLLNIISKY